MELYYVLLGALGASFIFLLRFLLNFVGIFLYEFTLELISKELRPKRATVWSIMAYYLGIFTFPMVERENQVEREIADAKRERLVYRASKLATDEEE